MPGASSLRPGPTQPADASASTSNELGQGVHHYVRPIFDGSQQDWRCYRDIHHKWHTVFLCYACQPLNVGYDPCRIAHALAIHRAGSLIGELLKILVTI